MVEVVGATVGMWVMVAVDLALLATRFHLRLIRQKARPHVSDWILLFTFLVILGENIIGTALNVDEIRFLEAHPGFPRSVDVLILGYTTGMRTRYLKRLYIVYFCNHTALYAGKFTLLMFFYEVFPRRLRKILHLTTVLVVSTFLSGLFATIFWCTPHSRMWSPKFVGGPDFCALRLLPGYNIMLFCSHITSTAAVVILPIVLLRWVCRGRKEVAFALSVMGFGAVSIAASVIAYLYIVNMQAMTLNPSGKHAAVVSMVADQNAVFWAASLSVFRVRRQMKELSQRADADDGKALVIRVERRYSVTVEIVQEWGHGWKDPWERGRLAHERIHMDTIDSA